MRKDLISFREECPPEQMVVPTAANGSSSSSSSQQQHHFTANFNFNLEHILTYDDGSGGSNSYDYQSQQQQQQQQQQPYYYPAYFQGSNFSYHQPVTTAGPVPLEMTQTPAAAAAAAAAALPYPEDFVNLLSTTESLPELTSTSTSFQTPITPTITPSITPTTPITPITPITPLSIPPTTVDHPLGRADSAKKYELNFIELHYIAQIVRASAAAFKDEDSAPVVANATDVVYILNLAEYYIGKTIRFAKSLSAFLVLSQEDQLALLKAFFTELLILRLGFFYQAATDGYLALVDHIGSPVSRGGANSGGGSSSNHNHNSQAIFIRLSTLFGKANKLHQATLIRHFVISYQAVVDKDSTLRDLVRDLVDKKNCVLK